MIINYDNREKVESIHLHDSNINSFKYDYSSKKIDIILHNEFINKNYDLLFENVIYCEIIGIELWGHSDNRIIDWELITDEKKMKELLYIEGIEKSQYPYSLFKRNPENKYISTLFTFSSGDTVSIICEKISIANIE